MLKKRLPRKKEKPKFEVISAPDIRINLGLTKEQEEELKNLIQENNGKSKRNLEKEKTPHTEHDPKLPPAA